jgi:hypothetical protein
VIDLVGLEIDTSSPCVVYIIMSTYTI